MSRTNSFIESLILKSQVMADNIEGNEIIKNRFESFNITSEKITNFRNITNVVIGGYEQQIQQQANQSSASSEVKQTWRAARKTHTQDVKIARSALDNEPDLLEILDVNSARKSDLAGWLAQANRFYDNSLNKPEILEKLTAYGLNETRLQASLQLVKNTESAHARHQDYIGMTQQARRDRDNIVEQLVSERRRLLAVGEAALADKPDLLEQLR